MQYPIILYAVCTHLKGSKAKSNNGLCSGLIPTDLATSAASLGLITDILLMSTRLGLASRWANSVWRNPLINL